MGSELDELMLKLAVRHEHGLELSPELQRSLLASLRAAVGEGSQALGESRTEPPRPAAWTAEDLLTAKEAAAALKVTPRWLYRHATDLPYARKLSRKVLRFSRIGITRWLATKRP